jgi:hypothetical protein
MKKITLKLTPTQYKLLIECLNQLSDDLSAQGCNDIFEEELKGYTKEDLQEMFDITNDKKYRKELYNEWKEDKIHGDIKGNWEDALKTGYGLWNHSPVNWLIKTIKKQKT